MRPWKRAAIAVIAFMVCLATGPNRAWAWGTVTNLWLNQEVRQNRSPYFIYAGSYPDMAIFYPELADHYHAPVVKRGRSPSLTPPEPANDPEAIEDEQDQTDSAENGCSGSFPSRLGGG